MRSDVPDFMINIPQMCRNMDNEAHEFRAKQIKMIDFNSKILEISRCFPQSRKYYVTYYFKRLIDKPN